MRNYSRTWLLLLVHVIVVRCGTCAKKRFVNDNRGADNVIDLFIILSLFFHLARSLAHSLRDGFYVCSMSPLVPVFARTRNEQTASGRTRARTTHAAATVT